MPRKGTTKAPAKTTRGKIEKTVTGAPANVINYADVQARLAAMSHGISIGKEAGLDMKAWVPHVLQAFGGYTVEEAKKFYPSGEYPAAEKKAEAPATPEPATAATAAASI